jgi:hypothetical protein
MPDRALEQEQLGQPDEDDIENEPGADGGDRPRLALRRAREREDQDQGRPEEAERENGGKPPWST